MVIYPDIEIKGGTCVTLVRGEMDQPVPLGRAPLELAKNYVGDGAEWLNVVDLDRVAGLGDNDKEVGEILSAFSTPVQVGGGIQSMARARDLADAGATRLVVGTAAVANPAFLKELVTAFPRRVVVSVDVWKGRVAIHGWKVTTSYEPTQYVRLLSGLDLAAIIITDIDRDLDLPDSSLALTMQVAAEAPVPVITSGTIKTLDDISRVRYLPHLDGAVVGRALTSGAFTLAEALEVARQ